MVFAIAVAFAFVVIVITVGNGRVPIVILVRRPLFVSGDTCTVAQQHTTIRGCAVMRTELAALLFDFHLTVFVLLTEAP